MMQTDRYFEQAQTLFFRWEDGGTVLCWDNGVTIAFREELAAVIKRLGPEGLPPLNAIAVVLSACRANWSEVRWFLTLYDSPEGLQDTPVLQDPDSWQADQLRAILAELDRIHALPESLRGSLEARCELAAMVFEDCPQEWNCEHADLLADRVRAGLPEGLQSGGGLLQAIGEFESDLVESLKLYSTTGVPTQQDAIRDAATVLTRDLSWLRNNLKRVDADALARRVRTGIESEVLPADDVDTDEQNTRDLIRELLGDEELGGIARLAENLFAVVHFPRSLTEQNDLPLGGVSDITNRGQLDRLLLSELAHDDLTLAVRVAVNEAMYLRRESPPKAQPQTRRILIDSGLCLWGIPRIFATSVALAMSATAEKNIQTVVYRAEGNRLQSVDLKSREGLEEHLAVVSPSLHCGLAIPEFVRVADQENEGDLVIITSDDVVADADFRRELNAACKEEPVHLMTVSRTGQLDLSVWSARGRKNIREATLNLDTLLDSPERSHSLTRRNTDTSFPMILSREDFPLRLPHGVVNEAVYELFGKTLAVTSDGRLMLWNEDGAGAIQLSDQLGPGKPLWQGWDSNGFPMVVYGELRPVGLLVICVDGYRRVQMTRLQTRETPRFISGFAGKIFVVGASTVEEFAPGTSDAIGSGPVPTGMHHSSRFFPPSKCAASKMSATSRFFRESGRDFVLASGGNGPVFTEVPSRLLSFGLFDHRGHGLVSVGTSADQSFPCITCPAEDLYRISNDGSVVLIRQGSNANRHNHCGTEIKYAYRNSDDHLHPELYDRISDRSLRNKFNGICVLNQRLCLRTNKGDILIVETDSTLLIRKVRPAAGLLQSIVPFQDAESPAGTGYTLKVAEWEDGSRAWLDSRCLLHLRSADRNVPEVTIVLAEGRLCGWAEEGGYLGTAYFSPSAEETDRKRDAEVCRKAIDGFVENL